MNTKVVYRLSGLHCPSCGLAIELAVADLPGVSSVEASYPHSQVTIEFAPDKSSEAQLKSAITSLGYQVEAV